MDIPEGTENITSYQVERAERIKLAITPTPSQQEEYLNDMRKYVEMKKQQMEDSNPNLNQKQDNKSTISRRRRKYETAQAKSVTFGDYYTSDIKSGKEEEK